MCSDKTAHDTKETLVPHANATLTELGRLYLAQYHLEQGATLAQTAERFQVSTTTVRRWVGRYRQVMATGRVPRAGDMADRSSRPRCSPNQTRRPVERKIVHLRVKKRLGPVQIGGRLGVPASTVHAVLVRARLNRLSWLDRATGQKVRRYEKSRPGEQVHVDIKKLALVPPGGGWRVHGGHPARGDAPNNRIANRAAAAARGYGQRGYAYVHSAVDDYSRVAYSEVLDDETAATAVGFVTRAVEFFAQMHVTVEEILTDNGPCYRSGLFAHALDDQSIRHRRTRRYRPQTNGKVERFNRTLLEEWAYAKAYNSESARRNALTRFIRIYNHHRAHSALGGKPPITRITTP